MKRIVPLLTLAVCIAAAAGAATTTAPQSASTTKPKSTSAAQTSSTTSSKSTKTATATSAPKSQAAPKAQHSSEKASIGGPELGLRAIGGSLGFVSPEGADGTYTLGVFADCGRITPNIAIEPRLDFWRWSKDEFGAKASVRDVILGARGKYMFETTNPKIQPYLGAGLSMHFLHSEVTIPPTGGFPEQKADDSSTKLGLDLGGGISTPMGPRTNLMGEAWYGVVTDVSQFSLRVGMSYALGQ